MKTLKGLSPEEMRETCVMAKYHDCCGLACESGSPCSNYRPTYDEIAAKLVQMDEVNDLLTARLKANEQAIKDAKAAVCPHNFVAKFYPQFNETLMTCTFCGYEYTIKKGDKDND